MQEVLYNLVEYKAKTVKLPHLNHDLKYQLHLYSKYTLNVIDEGQNSKTDRYMIWDQ